MADVDFTGCAEIPILDNAANWPPYYVKNMAVGNDGTHDATISAQSALIASSKTPDTLYNAYINRSLEYLAAHEDVQALADANHAISIEPDAANGHITRAAIYENEGQFSEADMDAAKAMVRNGPNYYAYMLQGQAFLRLMGGAFATLAARDAMTICPRSSRPYDLRGYAFQEEGVLDFALDDDNEAIALNPEDADAFIDRGKVYGREGNWDRDIADQTKAIALNPAYTGDYAERASAYSHEGRNAEAVADSTSLLSLDPRNEPALVSRSTYEDDAGKITAAIADATEAITLDPQDDAAWNDRCWYRSQAGALLDAFNDCDHALSLAPNSFNDLDSTGFVLLRLHMNDKAVVIYTMALKVSPHLASSLYGRGLAEQAEGERAAADADLAAAERSDPQIVSNFGK